MHTKKTLQYLGKGYNNGEKAHEACYKPQRPCHNCCSSKYRGLLPKQKNKFTPVFHKAMCHQCLMNTTKFCQCLTEFWDTLSVPSTFNKFSMKRRSVHTVHTYEQHRALEFLVKPEGAALPL